MLHFVDIGWSIIDTDYSPDQRWLIYSSWSDYGNLPYFIPIYYNFYLVHFCNIHGDFEIHDALDFKFVVCTVLVKFVNATTGQDQNGFVYFP